ncbi:MAG: N-6 DNA methylase, partial [Deltaproteobacteria bacterium]|nr:N-6 DNA methylase [Deltaproteobacteria bacterium]
MATKPSYKKTDAELRVHKDWLNLLQPVGLVVSPPALKAAQATPNTNVIAEQQSLIRLAMPVDEKGQSDWVSAESAENARIAHFPSFAVDVLGWREADLIEKPAELSVPVLDHDDTLSPTWAVKADDGSWLLLIREEAPFGKDLDVAHEVKGQEWEATPQARFERLLRETKVPIGVLCNGTQVRLVYAPPGESSGHVTFPVAAMCRVAGRPILAALLMLLGSARLWSKPEKERLPFILKESRKYQAVVTTKLADQVLDGLRELLNGFQSAHVASGGLLLQDMLATKAGRQEIYGGMLASILRCVFVLYAEDRGLMPQDETYLRGYSLTKLFEKLREDAALYPDTMDQRYGAWTQLLALFRLIFDGAEHGPLTMPAREGKLFNPDTYPFLEGRPWHTLRVVGEREKPPRVSDGVVYRLLEKLLLLDGERLSYRALDVEQIGSVYEALMGFDLEVALGNSIAVKPKHVVVDLDAILGAKANEREELLKKAEVKTIPKEVKTAKDLDGLVEALDKVRSPRSPSVIPLGAMYLQPGEERRRSGSHYTPRALTEPIVVTTLRPIFEQLGPRPRPKDILALKVCDPAMGSGAFLVEACRQLADKLVDAWNQHPLEKPNFKGEEMVLRARREVAQRCLYGVDKNPFAVDLAKLSLWLATLAKDHPFTFLDHSLKCGDSLVGLTKEQIVDMAWPGVTQLSVARDFVEARMKEALADREGIFALGDSDDVRQKQRYLRDAEIAMGDVARVGDIVLSAFFAGGTEVQRRARLGSAQTDIQMWMDGTVLQVPPAAEIHGFHWHVEFPEVFQRGNGGFDAVVGNPPFMAGKNISGALGDAYLDFLKLINPDGGGQADLVAYFFTRSFDLLRLAGCLGLLATNTISQGDTRRAALQRIVKHGAILYDVTKRVSWSGVAAVVTSVVHARAGQDVTPKRIDGRTVDQVTAFLLPLGGNDDPPRLQAMADLSFKGIAWGGQGFLFDDKTVDKGANALALMNEVLARSPATKERIVPIIGGEEMLEHPQQLHRRYVIDFDDLPEARVSD